MSIGIVEVVIVLLVVLIIFGPKRLPEIGKSLAKTIREFKSIGKDEKDKTQDTTPKDRDG